MMVLSSMKRTLSQVYLGEMEGDKVDGRADLPDDGLHGVHDLRAHAVPGDHGALDATLRVDIETPAIVIQS